MQKIWEKYGNIWEKYHKMMIHSINRYFGVPLFEEAGPISSCSLLQGFVSTSTVIYSFCQLFPFFFSWTILYPLHLVFVNDLSATGSGFASGKLACSNGNSNHKTYIFESSTLFNRLKNWQKQFAGWAGTSLHGGSYGGFQSAEKIDGFTEFPCFPKKWRPSSSHQLFLGHNSIIILFFRGSRCDPHHGHINHVPVP